jgi:hypothetical protein
MTYTTTTWTTVSVARVKPDYVVIYRKPDGTEGALDANMVLVQLDESSGGRRTVLGVVDTNTCEVIAAPDVPGYVELRSAAWEKLNARVTLRGGQPSP